MNPLTEIWFWLLIISIIGFIISFVLFETHNQVVNGRTIVPTWIWAIYFVSIALVAASFIIFCYRMHRYYQHLEILEACYGIIPSKPVKKSITCDYSCDNPCDNPCAPINVEPALMLRPLEQPIRVEQVTVEQIPVAPVIAGDVVMTATGKVGRVY